MLVPHREVAGAGAARERFRGRQDPQAFLEPDPVIADRCREHDVGKALDPPAERDRLVGPASCQARIMSTCSRVITAPNPISAPARAEQERLEDEVVVAGEERDLLGSCSRRRAVSTKRRASNEASLIATTPSTSHGLEDIGLVVHAAERRLELEQDEWQADVRDGRVVR